MNVVDIRKGLAVVPDERGESIIAFPSLGLTTPCGARSKEIVITGWG